MNNYGKSKKTLKIIVNLVNLSCVISRFHSSVNEICILLGFYTAENGCLLSTFQDNLSVPSLMVQQINIFLFGLPSSRSAINKIHFMTHKLKTILKIWPKAYIQKSKCHSLMVNYQLQSWLHTICWCTYLYDLSVPDLKSAAEVQSIIQGIVFTTLIKKRHNCEKDSHRSHTSQNFRTSGNEMSHAVWWSIWQWTNGKEPTTCFTRTQFHTSPIEHPASMDYINPLNAELNPICHLLALLETHPILRVSRIRVNGWTHALVEGPGTIHSSRHRVESLKWHHSHQPCEFSPWRTRYTMLGTKMAAVICTTSHFL
jgi:hypothetical protein